MSIATRMILIATLLVALAGRISAQETETATTAAPSTTTAAAVTETTASTGEAVQPQSSYETRNQFTALLRRNPDELARLLVLEPTLLNNKEFLASYPDLGAFLEQHPEVRLRPHFYLAEFQALPHRGGPLDDLTEPLITLAGFAFFAFALSWLLRTILEQRRWSRLTRTQGEVHNKILDRFGTTTELLEYIKSPAGMKFLESAPIPLRQDKPAASSPHARVIWSIHVGIVAAVAALGMLLVSARFADAEELFAMGAIIFFIGAGFIISALVSIYLSRRLNTLEGSPGSRIDDAGPVQ